MTLDKHELSPVVTRQPANPDSVVGLYCFADGQFVRIRRQVGLGDSVLCDVVPYKGNLGTTDQIFIPWRSLELVDGAPVIVHTGGGDLTGVRIRHDEGSLQTLVLIDGQEQPAWYPDAIVEEV